MCGNGDGSNLCGDGWGWGTGSSGDGWDGFHVLGDEWG